jgi:hypothetical protein
MIAKRKSTKNDLQNTTQKTEDRATLTPLKTGNIKNLSWISFTVPWSNNLTKSYFICITTCYLETSSSSDSLLSFSYWGNSDIIL